MKRTMITFVAAAAAFAAPSAFAGYIYAMVQDAHYADGTRVDFDYAKVKATGGSAVEGGDYLYFFTPDSSASLGQEYASDATHRNYSDGACETETDYAQGFYVGYDADKYYTTFLFELWLNSDVVGTASFGTSELLDSLVSDSGRGGAKAAVVSTVVIPEPTSALLMLLGVAALVLRRRSRRALLGVAVSMAVFAANAAQNDLLISFSTKGPDTYADGTTVMDGECYALVWIPEGASGAAIASDGTAADGAKIVLVAPIAKNGRCPNVVYRVSAERVASEFKKGSWSVYMLDTRRYAYDENGNSTVTLAGFKSDGTVRLVNASGKVGDATLKANAGDNVSLAAAVAATAERVASLPEDVPQPKISGIEVRGGNVYVTVENAAPYLSYDLEAGDTPDAVSESLNRPCTGSDDGTVVLVAPAKEGGAFFRVNRTR